MSGDNGNWCLIESDPGVFTELIQNMGVKDVQVEELYSLDTETLRAMEPVYGLIFLFKWQPTTGTRSSVSYQQEQQQPENVYFAQQIIQNACATQAILSILMNREKDLDIGETLSNLRSFSIDLPPDMRGLALTNCDELRKVHNSFQRIEAFLNDIHRPATEDDDVFHFVSYVPVNGRLYELDGLKPAPIDHGATNDWLTDVSGVIQNRINEYSQTEIRFNLMAVTSDPRRQLAERITSVDADISRLAARLETLKLKDVTESREEASIVESRLGALNYEREVLISRAAVEGDKFDRYKFENSLRKHNFIPLIYQLLRGMAQKGELIPAIEKSQGNPKSSSSRSK
ncbi:hypothetical protein IW140_003375 [Coemansia sp. RSA 1813]|nr:hypothetical protein EV178_003193 [Coemansia sp. RSA 1646]KAJ1771000.1 hypothetical protein LPJ74_002691 [Coemansia sp. RSA 1843]KAJ2089240.1 hypothetical protein IW138_003560 [Coemansia sp. RSA 986]KAJ2215069.1 hypothetical protein EV179_002437 [Coemansia sp. RSA 487]KAJ2569010.1 hypothetical protein IW140_003375 [Coemansia sp. RSA 1813]